MLIGGTPHKDTRHGNHVILRRSQPSRGAIQKMKAGKQLLAIEGDTIINMYTLELDAPGTQICDGRLFIRIRGP